MSIIAVFSVAGIMLGVAALIIVLSVMNGFRQEMLDKFLGLHSHVIVKPLGKTFAGYSETAERLKAVPGVKSTFAVIEGRVMISSEAGSSGVVVRGMGDRTLTRCKPFPITSATVLSRASASLAALPSARVWPIRSTYLWAARCRSWLRAGLRRC